MLIPEYLEGRGFAPLKLLHRHHELEDGHESELETELTGPSLRIRLWIRRNIGRAILAGLHDHFLVGSDYHVTLPLWKDVLAGHSRENSALGPDKRIGEVEVGRQILSSRIVDHGTERKGVEDASPPMDAST